MFRSNFRTLINLKTSISRGSPLFANSTLRASILNTLRSFPKRAFSTKGRLFKFSGGGGGSSKLDELIEQLVRRLPNGNVGALLVGINTFFYAVYLMWPRDIMHKFLNNFTISNYNLSRGRFHTLIFSHFAHMGFLSYAIDSLILYLFCQNLMFFHGPNYIVKLVLLSMGLGSALLLLQHSSSQMNRPWWGNDSIMRGLIFTVIFQNPTASFYLFPFPISIPAWAIAALLLGLDFLSLNTASFGGISASYLMLNYLR